MPDDAPQPPSNFFTSTTHSLSRLTHFIDENIRVIQYGVYCVGAAGAVVVLHSVRAFTKFAKIQDIPKEFISKHVRLHGHVRWVGVTPPTPPTTPPHSQANSSLAENGTRPAPFSSGTETAGKRGHEGDGGRSLSADNRGIYEGAGELHPWEDGIDPALARINYMQDMTPLFLQVEHSPVFAVVRRKTDQLLPLQLADVEIFAKSVNEQLVRDGLALAGPLNLQLHGDKRYTQLYTKLLKAQEYAEKKKLGMWKPSEDKKGLLARLWGKIRAFGSK
ncbi:hypothetical protein E2C01_014295 [Portunus trituberculatus]|uniref:TNase-like domain-containing protein n=1 Tax=Portunus trituberculatus TaxID=210409 RepID=A0A5B7DJM1_PORTR|nr:hypothetical protein [Portunus trituberculatus]